jgi:hypothetical protein
MKLTWPWKKAAADLEPKQKNRGFMPPGQAKTWSGWMSSVTSSSRWGVTPELLRWTADTYDPLRACIEHLKREVASVPIKIASKTALDDSPETQKRIEEATEFFRRMGGYGGIGRRPAVFEKAILEDLLVLGSCALFLPSGRTSAGCDEVYELDAAAIRPLIDAHGWPDPEAAYEQVVLGQRVRTFTSHELMVEELNPVTYSPLGRSPIEWLMLPITTGLKADEWNRTWLTEGTTPGELLQLPEGWTPDQIREFWEFWNEMMDSGGLRERRRLRVAPSGSRLTESKRKDQEFSQLEQWMVRRTCSVFGVSPSAIGYEGEIYKVSQEGARRQTSMFGAGPLLEFRKALWDELLERRGFGDLEAVQKSVRDEDSLTRAQRLTSASGGPYITVNEARKEEGLPPLPQGDELRKTNDSY